MTSPRPERTCACCCQRYVNQVWRKNATCRRGNRGYCPRCYLRWQDHGFPESGPPEPGIPGRKPGSRAGRIEDYAELKSWGLSRAEAALRLDVTRRTITRYEEALRAGETRAA